MIELDTELWFGKHEGQTLAWVLDNDHEWIIWANDNLDRITIDPDVVKIAKEAAEKGW